MMSRDNANMMTREDVLRELELLPAWQLRVPALQKEPSLPQEVAPVVTETVTETVTEAVIENIPPVAVLTQKSDAVFDIFQSEDSTWVFACSAGLIDTASQGMLLNNIAVALQIKTKKHNGDLAEIQAKIIVAMGESVAQTLLNSQDNLDNLRGKLHSVGAGKLIASDDLAHLIANPLDKARLWQDLCLARSYLQNLQSQD